MRWYCMNVYEEHISNGNIRYEKIEPETRKTDGFFIPSWFEFFR